LNYSVGKASLRLLTLIHLRCSSLFTEDVHVAFVDGWRIIEGNLGIVVVDPLACVVLLTSMCDVMSGVDTSSQMCNEALHLKHTDVLICLSFCKL